VRNLLFLLLCAVLLGGGAAAHAAPASDGLTYTQPIVDQRSVIAGGALTVGTPIAMNGYFATDLWGINTADLDVRALLHGYQTVVWEGEKPLLNGTVLKSVDVREAADGAWVFTMEITAGLSYNDGTPITARDYVFSLLLEASPAVKALGGAPSGHWHIAGYDAYRAGETDAFAGVYLISPTTFVLEITGDAMFDFYGPAPLLGVTPYPIHVIAPGFDVMDEGEGAFMVRTKDGARGGLTAELLQETLLDPADGYVCNPRVTSGPYELVDADLVGSRAAFTINPRFAGDAWGNKPVIETLYFVHVHENDAAAKLASGEIELMNKMLNPAAVDECDAVRGISKIPYPRTGLAYLAFVTERGPGSESAVRKAIAMTLDCNALVGNNSGLERVYGYYGIGQWMAIEASQEALNALEIPFDPQGANALLNTTAWNMNEDGGAYVAGKGKIRHQDQDGILEPLRVIFARSEESGLSADVAAMLSNGLEKIGAELQMEIFSFPELLQQYYHQRERSADLFFLASDFPLAFFPPFARGEDESGYLCATSFNDAELTALANTMMSTGFENRTKYLDTWMAFQCRFMEELPMIPIYSGKYHDFYTPGLINYNIAAMGSWARAIVSAEID